MEDGVGGGVSMERSGRNTLHAVPGRASGAVSWGWSRCAPQLCPGSGLPFQPHQQPRPKAANTPKGKASGRGLLGREVVMCGLASGTDCTKQETEGK